MSDPDQVPPDFGCRYILWRSWKVVTDYPYDTLGIIQMALGSVIGISGGLPHPWGSLLLVTSGFITNVLARYAKPKGN